MRGTRIAIVLVVLLAGCTVIGPETATDTATDRSVDPRPTAPATPVATHVETADPTSTPTATGTVNRTPKPTQTSTPVDLENPWGRDPVVVAVNDSAGGAEEKYGVFREALEYWAEHDVVYAGVDVPFSFEPDAESPDITIRYVRTIEDCGETETVTDPLGCAPYYRDHDPAQHTVVYIRENEDDRQLLATVKHELGHVLGIGHGENPMPLMAENNLYLLASPWDLDNVTYYVDYTDKPGYGIEAYDREIGAAFGYLEDGADGNLDPPPSFHRVERPGAANVIIEFHDDPVPGSGEAGSRGEGLYEGEITGTPYRRFTIGIYDLEPDVTSYHVAYWYAQIVIGEGESYPDILIAENCDVRCRQGEWYD